MFIQGGTFVPDSIVYNKVAAARCDHQKSKLRAVAGSFWFAEVRGRQVKIGSKSGFAINLGFDVEVAKKFLNGI